MSHTLEAVGSRPGAWADVSFVAKRQAAYVLW